MKDSHTVMCPPQPLFAQSNELSTMRVYQSARSVPVGVKLRTALSACATFSHQRLVLT